MRQSWQMWQSGISPQDCDDIIERIRHQKAENSIVGHDEHSRVYGEYRSSLTRWVEEPDIQDMLWRFAREANRMAFGVDVTDMAGVQFTEYNASMSAKYDWHHDVEWQKNLAYDRKISVVVQLSDGNYYEGCDFQFEEVQNPDQEALRCKGTVLCFPSYLRHRVTEITKGTRYSLVAWFEGPRWK